MLLVSFWMERRCLEPRALKVTLHLPDNGAVADQRRLRLGTKVP